MKVMVIVKASKESEAGAMPDKEVLTKMNQFNEELVKAGILLGMEGLHPTSKGVRVRFPGGTVIDGPFAEAKECVGGYWMIQVKSKEEAIEWAKRAPMSDNEMIEVRQVHEMGDFPPDVRAAAAGFDELLGRK